MPDAIHYLTYDDLIDFGAAGYHGTSYARWLSDLGGGDGEYTVYWPKDSIRVADGLSYAVASALSLLLRDERTLWMGRPTREHPAVISRPARGLAGGLAIASTAQVENQRVYAADRYLPHDTRTNDPEWSYSKHQFGGEFRFDFSSLPE